MDYFGMTERPGTPPEKGLDRTERPLNKLWKDDWIQKRTSGRVIESKPAFVERKKSVDIQTKLEEHKEEFVTMTFPDGSTFQLPIFTGTCGPKVVDVRGLYGATGYFTFDPGFTSTCSCNSSITFIDGPKGILTHRGYRIEALAENSDFEEVSYLLWYGDLPNKTQKYTHVSTIHKHTMIHEKLIKFYNGFKSDAHPMAIMVGVVGALSAFYHDSLNIRDPEHRQLAAYRLLAKIPTIASIAYKTAIGEPIVYPRDDLNYAENFLYMMFARPTSTYELNPIVARALETFLILHADHEQNASTSTVRIAGSSYANPFACVAAGIVTLWGPAHGGANEAVIAMLEEIETVDRISIFLEKAKSKSDPFRLMGFGHRVYKNYDPRAKIMKKMCYDVIHDLGIKNEPYLQIALELEKAALTDDYFISRKLFPNVDFYSGIMLRAIGIPISMYTVLFAVARTVGWVSQWKEMIEDPQQRIGRPRQLYRGKVEREFVPLDERPQEHSQPRLISTGSKIMPATKIIEVTTAGHSH
eukprot:1014037_1